MTRRKDGEKVRLEKMNMNDYVAKYGYKPTDTGAIGKAFERACKEHLHMLSKVARAGQSDLRRAKVYYEVKTSSGELGNDGEKLVKGSSRVIYCPRVESDKELEKQVAFVLSREDFLHVLESCGLLREKTSSNGQRKITIQTFWNNKLNAPHGKKYFKLLDALNTCVSDGKAMTFTSWLENGWAI